MMEEARARLLAGERVPLDPLSFAIDWYNATSEVWSRAVGGVIGNEGFVAMASRFLEGYMTYAKTFRHVAQEYVSAFQLASRQDIARTAGLVVALEDKVDHLEDQLDDLTAASSKLLRTDLVSNGALGGIERLRRIGGIERLRRIGGRYALVTMCIGGGQGIAAVFERL